MISGHNDAKTQYSQRLIMFDAKDPMIIQRN